MEQDKIVALGLLTQHDLSMLGANFRRAFPIADDGGFDGLLRAIERADDDYRQHLTVSTGVKRVEK